MSQMQTQLAVRQEIARELDELIRAAGKSVQKLEKPDRKDIEMKESQIRNVVNVAAGSRSIEEVTNFIRYQIGRDGRKITWGYSKPGDKSFGAAVIADIEAGQVKSAVEAVMRKVPSADLVSVRSEMIALYLGYLNRCFIYAVKTGDWKNLVSDLGAREET